MAEPIQVVSPEGRKATVEPQDLDYVLQQGFRLESAEEAGQRAKEAEYGTLGQEVLTGLEGAAKGITFGVSTPLQIAFGADPENIRARQEVNPNAHLAGEVAGGVALGLATAGVGTGAGAASVAKTGGSLAARAGAAALREGLAGAALGAAGGAGNVIHEAALGNPNLTAENVVEQIGLGALMGGGLGAALGGAGVALPEAIKGARNAVGGAFQKGKSQLGKLYGAAEGVTGTEGNVANFMIQHSLEIEGLERALPGMADNISTATPEMASWMVKNGSRLAEMETAFPGTSKAISRVDPATAEELVSNWKSIITDPKARKAMTGNLKQGMQEVVDNTNKLLKRINTEFVKGEEEALLSSVSKEAAEGAYERVASKIDEALGAMRAKKEQFAPGYASKLEDIRLGLERDVADTPAAIFQRVKTLRQQVDELINFEAQPGALSFTERNAQSVLKDVRKELKSALVDEATWGPAAARRAGLDEAQAQWMRLTGKGGIFRKRFMEKGASGGYEVPATKVNTWLNGMATGKGEESAAAWGKVMEAAKRVVDEAEASAAHIPTSAFDKKAAAGLLEKTASQMDEAQRAASVTAMHKQLLSGGMGIAGSGPVTPTLGQGLLGQAAGAVLPGAVTRVASTVTSVPRTVKVLGAMERAGQAASKKIDDLAASIARGARPAAHVGETVGATLQPNRVAELASNPAALQAELQRVTDGVHEHAPETAQALQIGTARTIAFLASKLPPPVQRGPLGPQMEPSPGQLSAYNRCAAIVEQPTRILGHLSAGTLTPDMVEAAEVCAPQMLAKMRTSVLDKLTEQGDFVKLPYRTRLGLQLFLGQSLDGTGTPQAIQANQAAYQRPSQRSPENQTGDAAMKPTQTGMGKLKSASRMATPGQGAEQRMGRE